MALAGSEAIFAKAMILHGNKLRAIKEAYPRLEEGFEQAALRYMMQNPEVQKHIEAGILYLYRDVIKQGPRPELEEMTAEEKQLLLQLVIDGKREKPAHIITKDGLKTIFTEPSEEEIAIARQMLQQLGREAA